MKNIYLGNAFSLQMLDTTVAQTFNVSPVSEREVAESGFVSVIGHDDTASIVSAILGCEVKKNRTSVKLESGDVLYVAQVDSGRLPEGATTLPEGMKLVFLKVTL